MKMKCSVRELEVITRLQNLNSNKTALENLPDRYRMLEAKAYSIKAVKTDAEPVAGGTSRGEDARIENLIEREHVQHDLEYARLEVKQLENALNLLSDKERIVLERMYINRVKDPIGTLIEELKYEQAQIYRIKHAAINHLGDVLYGTRRK